MLNKNTILTVVLILILVIISLMIVNNAMNRNKVGVNNVLVTPTSSIAPPNAPKEFKYDSNTDLKKELDSIDPQMLDSDFE